MAIFAAKSQKRVAAVPVPGRVLIQEHDGTCPLDEARQTADPVHLMRLSGISDTTAMKYVFTAHPDRKSVPGR
jgi:hypothetical protein